MVSDYARRWLLGYRAWWVVWSIFCVVTGQALNPYEVGAASKGEDAAAYSLSLMGSRYVYGAAGPSTFDCSGMVQYVGGHIGVSLPRTAADQAAVGQVLGASLWAGDLPVGALLFLADSNIGPGITHVSLYLGSGQASDCYNETDGCIVHDVASSAYYRDHWVYATYPWGDTPVVGAGPNIPANTSPTNGGVTYSQVSQALTQPGPLAVAAATPVAALGETMETVVHAGGTSVDPLDAGDLAHDQMAGVGLVIGYAKMLDELFPLKMVPMLAVVVLFAGVRVSLSFARYVKALLDL